MKTFVFFSLPFFLFSCTTDLLEQENTIVNNSENIELLTRAGDIDFNPLSELKDIPVYIINTGNTQNQYLLLICRIIQKILTPYVKSI